jgi:quinol monooxygenase YgiN
MEPIHATIKMRIPFNKEPEVMEILSLMTEQIQVEAGCLLCRLFRSFKDPHMILLEQRWSNEEEMIRHLRSDRYGKILLALEMAMEAPEIRFDYIARSRGMDLITFARGQPA